MSKPILKSPTHNLEPGDPLARAQGCICSPERNNDGHGVETSKGRTFYPSNECPLHGLDAVMEIWKQQGGKGSKRPTEPEMKEAAN